MYSSLTIHKYSCIVTSEHLKTYTDIQKKDIMSRTVFIVLEIKTNTIHTVTKWII